MAQLDLGSFAVGITALEEVFDKDLSDRVKDAYFAALSRLTPEQWETAVNRCIAECRFLPRPAELLERSGVNADPEAEALEALAQVRRAIGAHGRYRSVDFTDDPAINAALRSLGGWIAACELSEEEWSRFKSREFRQAYTAIRASGCSEDTARYLPGLEERNWRAVDGEPPKPVTIRAPESRQSLPAPRESDDRTATLPGGRPETRSSTREAAARSVDPRKVHQLTAGLAAKKAIGGGS